MSRTLTRRRFARLAVAGGVAAGSITLVTAPLANTIFARPAHPVLIGLSASPVPSTALDAPEVDATEFEPPSNRVVTDSLALSLELHSLDLSTGQVRSLPSMARLADGATPVLRSNELVTGCALLSDGTLIAAITPVSGSRNEQDATRLTQFRSPPTSIAVSGLRRDEQLGDLLATADGRLLGLVSKRDGRGPTTLVSVDTRTGRLSVVDSAMFAGYWRVNTLAESPQGVLHATGVTPKGETHLLQLGAGRAANAVLTPLSVDGAVWNNGLQSLVYSNAGQLIAFGAMRYDALNRVYAVDARTGAMTRLFDFDVARVAISFA
jgi:hypothetical protein